MLFAGFCRADAKLWSGSQRQRDVAHFSLSLWLQLPPHTAHKLGENSFIIIVIIVIPNVVIVIAIVIALSHDFSYLLTQLTSLVRTLLSLLSSLLSPTLSLSLPLSLHCHMTSATSSHSSQAWWELFYHRHCHHQFECHKSFTLPLDLFDQYIAHRFDERWPLATHGIGK